MTIICGQSPDVRLFYFAIISQHEAVLLYFLLALLEMLMNKIAHCMQYTFTSQHAYKNSQVGFKKFLNFEKCHLGNYFSLALPAAVQNSIVVLLAFLICSKFSLSIGFMVDLCITVPNVVMMV